MKYLLTIIIPAFLFVSCIQMSTAKTFEETVKKKIEFPSGGKVLVQNINGRVEVEGWAKNTVLIEAVKKVKASDKSEASEYLDAIKIRIDRSDDEIRVKTKMPHLSNSFWDWIFGSAVSGSVSYRVMVPAQTNLDLVTTNGHIGIQNVAGKIEVKTTNGKIEGENISGVVRAITTNGSIEFTFDKIDGESSMYFLTTNGGITVVLPEDVNCDINAATTNGSISSDFPLEIKGKYNSRKVNGKVNSGGPLLKLRTTNGSIRILKK